MMAASGLWVIHEWLHSCRARGRCPIGLSKRIEATSVLPVNQGPRLVSRSHTLTLARRGSGLHSFAAYTAIQSDCRTGSTSRNKMASFKRFGDSEISLS